MTEPAYIQPAVIDHIALLDDLKALGWKDSKIETVCGFASGYVSQLRCHNISQMAYWRAVRLHNFWVSEKLQELDRLAEDLQNRGSLVTT